MLYGVFRRSSCARPSSLDDAVIYGTVPLGGDKVRDVDVPTGLKVAYPHTITCHGGQITGALPIEGYVKHTKLGFGRRID